MNADQPIGVMDSGAGGLYVLRQLTRLLPREDFLFLGDQAHAPYGGRDTREIQAIVDQTVDALCRRSIKCLVVACNTATAADIVRLRQRLSIPVVGTEPALKPAVAAFPQGPIAVMATPSTAASEKLAHLRESLSEEAATILPCPGLATLIEQAGPGSAEIRDYLRELFKGFYPKAVVLGCTHYSFLRRDLEAVLGKIAIFDGADGVARQTQRLLAEQDLLKAEGSGSVEIGSTGGEATLALLQRFWQMTEALS